LSEDSREADLTALPGKEATESGPDAAEEVLD